MSSPESISDPLFWPWFLFAAVMVVVVLAFTWVVHRITTPRPEPPPRDQRQRSGDGGVNLYDASTHDDPSAGHQHRRAQDARARVTGVL